MATKTSNKAAGKTNAVAATKTDKEVSSALGAGPYVVRVKGYGDKPGRLAVRVWTGAVWTNSSGSGADPFNSYEIVQPVLENGQTPYLPGRVHLLSQGEAEALSSIAKTVDYLAACQAQRLVQERDAAIAKAKADTEAKANANAKAAKKKAPAKPTGRAAVSAPKSRSPVLRKAA